MTTLQMPLQLNHLWATKGNLATTRPLETAVNHIRKKLPPGPRLRIMRAIEPVIEASPEPEEEPVNTYAFYRKHTESMLRRYLYASMQVGRTPNLLGENVGRGWVSSRRVSTFEDALIFVLDVERCLNRLTILDRLMISRILLQEYTHTEAAVLIGVSVRSITSKLPQAIDRLTESLVDADLLILPN